MEVNVVTGEGGRLKEQGLRPEYIQFLQIGLKKSLADTTLFNDENRTSVSKGEKQSDTVSPKLFSA